MPDVLIVDDDPVILPTLKEYLGNRNIAVRTAATLSDARTELAKKLPDGLLVDLVLPDGSGLELVDLLKNDPVQIIIMTGFPSLDTAIASVRSNAIDYLVKPIQLGRLRSWLSGLGGEDAKTQTPVAVKKADNGDFFGMIGDSEPMRRVQKMIEKVAPSNITVLLQGESGTGKEVAARAIHQSGLRKDQPLLALNCGASNENLIGDELFGHERGGFTGANRQHKGYFERANGGTLFLDEVTEMPIDLQAHLLRVLETGKLVRIGGDTEVKTDVRLIAATNRDPHEAIAAGKLREDLYYRLAVFPIQLPPLRERKDDIDKLTLHFVEQFNQANGVSKTIEPDVIAYLRSLSWPGNIRQLRNAVQRAHLIADQTITRENFTFDSYPSIHEDALSSPVALVTQTNVSIDQVERSMILSSLEQFKGNKKLAAEALGISLKTLYNKLKKYEMTS